MDYLSEAKVWIIFVLNRNKNNAGFWSCDQPEPFFYSSHRWRPWGLAQVAPPGGHLRQARRSCRQVALTAHSWDSEYVLHMCQTNTFAHIWARKRDYVWKKKKWCQGKLDATRALASIEFTLTVAQSASSSRGSGRFLCASMRINPPPQGEQCRSPSPSLVRWQLCVNSWLRPHESSRIPPSMFSSCVRLSLHVWESNPWHFHVNVSSATVLTDGAQQWLKLLWIWCMNPAGAAEMTENLTLYAQVEDEKAWKIP